MAYIIFMYAIYLIFFAAALWQWYILWIVPFAVPLMLKHDMVDIKMILLNTTVIYALFTIIANAPRDNYMNVFIVILFLLAWNQLYGRFRQENDVSYKRKNLRQVFTSIIKDK